jgi:hypothetical protein
MCEPCFEDNIINPLTSPGTGIRMFTTKHATAVEDAHTEATGCIKPALGICR